MEKDQSTDKARVVAYLRTASGREGIIKQRKEIEEFAKKVGITIDEFLELEAVRAEKGIIKLFQRLRPNDKLIITDLPRLTRKITDLPKIMDELKDNEILVTALT
jgi:DNA invertase Pin-like site-specific DNA recombinase